MLNQSFREMYSELYFVPFVFTAHEEYARIMNYIFYLEKLYHSTKYNGWLGHTDRIDDGRYLS